LELLTLLRSLAYCETLDGMTGPVALVAVALGLALLAVAFLSLGREKKPPRKRRQSDRSSSRPSAARPRGNGAPSRRRQEPESIATLDDPLDVELPKLRYDEDDAEITLLTLGGGSETPPSERE